MTTEKDTGFWSGYKGMGEVAARYFKAYGGLTGFIRSPYLHFSLLLTLFSAHIWMRPGWWDHPITILPSLLGFSLGGYAIWLAWGDDAFRSVVAGREVHQVDGKWEAKEGVSPYIGVSATFAHYIVIQVVSILYALAGSALNFVAPDDFFVLKIVSRDFLINASKVGGAIGYWLFIYSLLTALAAGFGLFRISTWYDQHHTVRRLKKAREDARQKNFLGS